MSEAPRTTDEEFRSFMRDRFRPTVGRLMKRERRLSQADAEDIVQNAFLEAYKWWSKIRDPEGFLWDRVKKRTLDHWEKQKSTPETPCDTSDRAFARPAPKGAEPDVCVEFLHYDGLISQLPPETQRLVVMAARGASGQELAKEFGVKEGAIRVRLVRARQQLRALNGESEAQR
ncbi:RNA polymerase sigma factor [Streptomyces sp. NPDC053367]|uniref:RNA polymerase sigma factor n=1 Tax=Streptomyces sp. NPDC053367 TaxID=3365700 RepID=UPI0037CFEB7A